MAERKPGQSRSEIEKRASLAACLANLVELLIDQLAKSLGPYQRPSMGSRPGDLYFKLQEMLSK
ncbi:MAG: hypothetical protein GF381_02160 [Candidatus Pacebacteria bacterium]|nr:hypothetical protein [Candidatus Paceibacterota bacterium]